MKCCAVASKETRHKASVSRLFFIVLFLLFLHFLLVRKAPSGQLSFAICQQSGDGVAHPARRCLHDAILLCTSCAHAYRRIQQLCTRRLGLTCREMKGHDLRFAPYLGNVLLVHPTSRHDNDAPLCPSMELREQRNALLGCCPEVSTR